MSLTRKDFFVLATGVFSFVGGLVLIGNFIPENWLAGLGGIALVAAGVYLTGVSLVKDKK